MTRTASKFGPTADEVRALRDRDGLGMIEAKAILRRENLIRAVGEIRAGSPADGDRFDRLLDVVEDLIHDPL